MILDDNYSLWIVRPRLVRFATIDFLSCKAKQV